MKRSFFFLLLISFAWQHASAATFTSLSSTYPSLPSYPPANPHPGARVNAAVWNTTGEMWLFGGQLAGQSQYACDLWRLNLTSTMWTYVGGPKVSNQPGQYFAVAGRIAAWPGCRSFSGTFTDYGLFFLFGGLGYGSDSTASGQLSDMWRYSIFTGKWVHLHGSESVNQLSVYTGSSPKPGGRSSPVTWVDKLKNFYLLGGYRDIGYINDMWQYNWFNNTWTFLRGSQGVNQPSVLSGPTAIPSGRSGAAGWSDIYTGDLYLFGGSGICSSASSANTIDYLSDLWKFNGTWYLISGSNNCASPGVYSGTDLKPAARSKSYAWFDYANRRLVMFGGWGTITSGQRNDLWTWSLATSKWAWLAGSSTTGTFPTSTMPGARSQGMAVPDLINPSRFYMYGGVGPKTVNGAAVPLHPFGDLWVLVL